MPRKAKVKIEVGSHKSFENLCNDIYHDLYTQRTQVLNDLSRMLNQAELKDDHSLYQVYKARANLFSLLTQNSSTKLLLAKLLSTAVNEDSSTEQPEEKVTLAQMSMLRKLINETKREQNN